MRHKALFLTLAITALTACGSYDPQPTQAVYDTSDTSFWALPFPDQKRFGPDSTWGIDQWPRSNRFLSRWIRAVEHFEAQSGGYGLNSGVFFPISGKLEPSSLPSVEKTLTKNASVFLMDIDPNSPECGRRFPLEVVQLQGDTLIPENLLMATPKVGYPRRPNTRYGAFLTGALKDAQGEILGASRTFYEAWSEAESGPLAEARAILAAEKVDTESIVAAALFKTGDTHALAKTLAAWAESLPVPQISDPWTVTQDFESFVLLETTIPMPQIQEGEPPYSDEGEGKIVFDDEGLPVIHSTQAVRLALTLPKTPMPGAGFPLTLYMHGSGGNYYQAVERSPKEEVPKDEQGENVPGEGPSKWLAQRGVATLAFDFPLHGDRHSPPDTTGLKLYNLDSNPMGTIYNFNVAMAELLLISRFALTISADPGLHAALLAAADGAAQITIDPERFTALGQSMGTTIGIPWAAFDPRLKGVVFSGTGGLLTEIATSSIEPFDVKALLNLLADMDEGESLHRQHPFLHAIQNMWDLIDPVAKAPHLLLEPFIQRDKPLAVMMTAGFRDGYFHPYAQSAVAVALGAQPWQQSSDPILAEAMAFAGQQGGDLPFVQIPEEPVNILLGYDAPNELGHYVIFNQQDAIAHYTCFLATVGTTGGVFVPALAQGSCAP